MYYVLAHPDTSLTLCFEATDSGVGSEAHNFDCGSNGAIFKYRSQQHFSINN